MFVVDDKHFASETDAAAYANSRGLVILEFYPDEGEMVADYEYLLDAAK